ncbi:MAG TPA: hypothetical protein VFN78_02520 [Ktedonobacterales bacterium]|nr:hypothetical protein [Ktedonobacterales bacterium]
MAVRSSINQQVQIGVESVHGTPVPAGKLLTAFTWVMGGKPTTKQFRGTGRQYPSASALLYEESMGKVSGEGDFAQLAYILASLWGSGTPTLHAPSTTAYDWTWTPPLVGSYAANAKSFTLQMGDSVDAEQYAFAVFHGFGYSFGRKSDVSITADLIAQVFTDGVTLTASPTAVEKLPMTGAQFNVYLDATSGGIGTTQLTAPLKVDYKASGYYDGFYPINRANASFSDLVDKEKKHELKLSLEADSTAIAFRGSYLQPGDLCYVRVNGQGPTIDVTNSVKASMQHDMACFVTNMSEFGDEEGVYKVDYTLAVAEDSAWNTGEAQKFTLTNLLSAL